MPAHDRPGRHHYPLPRHPGTAAATRRGEVIVKLHERPERHRQELHAYQRWVPSLGDRAPRLLATTDGPLTLVITAVPGQLLADGGLDRDAERDAYRQAGAILRDLHAAGPPGHLPDMTAWLYERGMAWLDVTRDIIPAHRRAEITEHWRRYANSARTLLSPAISTSRQATSSATTRAACASSTSSTLATTSLPATSSGSPPEPGPIGPIWKTHSCPPTAHLRILTTRSSPTLAILTTSLAQRALMD